MEQKGIRQIAYTRIKDRRTNILSNYYNTRLPTHLQLEIVFSVFVILADFDPGSQSQQQ